MVQQNQYGGLPHEDPNIYLATFLEICDTVKINGVSVEIIHLKLFPFFLRDRARSWLQSLPSGSVAAWEDMAQKFLIKFFPPSKTSQLRAEITQFWQFEYEQLYEAWERFKEMLHKCPQHGIEVWFQVQLFYNGLTRQTKAHIDAAAGGTILSKIPGDALNLFEDMAMNSCQWQNERSTVKRAVGIYDVDQTTSLMAQMALLTNQIQGLTAANANGNQEAVKMAQASSSSDSYDEQCHFVNRSYNFRPNNNLPTYYHPGLRNYENFSYANNRNVLQPTLESSKPAMEKPSSSLEELLKMYIVDSKARLDQHDAPLNNIETHCTNLGGTMKALETQVGQLANAIKGQSSRSFPSNTEKNPREHKEPIKSNDDGKDKSKEENLKAKKEAPVVRPGSITFSDNPPRITPPLPFPQRFQKKALDEQFEKFLNIFKRIHINIPFVDALEQMPNYAKFMKGVMSKKLKLEDYETVKLTEECSAIIKRQLSEKLKDPESFTIPCKIGGSTFERALCDLGASINLMPLSVLRKLGLGEVTPTTISLQMADRSITYPWGIIEDVLVKVDKFIFPVDFVVLDMEEDQEIPIILGRPFLATGRALIDVHSGNLTLKVNEEKAIFNILNPKKSPQEKPTCNRVEELKSCIKEFTQEVMPKDSLGNGPTNSLTIIKLSNEHCPKKDDAGEYIVKRAEAIATPMNNEMVVAKKKAKKKHDQRTSWQDLTPGQRVLLFNSQLKLSPEKVESRSSGTFKIKRVFSFCTIELKPGG
ncbi:uncharacterized protein LOC112093949 [Morus notabilis]|uniref:uncharacterized protein LOC112093949 n=1 Tax=Morus notabilis TaxID=981085 RepID=UPI000CED1671|nr:uncharacterized protein LOC112093949 [Morus notabilis]